jgi:hypothetical protein
VHPGALLNAHPGALRRIQHPRRKEKRRSILSILRPASRERALRAEHHDFGAEPGVPLVVDDADRGFVGIASPASSACLVRTSVIASLARRLI